ncbi:AlpA family phage regulatory protein [uncultured Sphingomonas sp.]|uniref:AlpA family phage regulatory protein n=1 Tax=uncultured Sphingomonas sp. TaxID=158754 RepID=UPI0035C9D605
MKLDRIMRRFDVEAVTGLSRSSIYAAIARGDFPRPFTLLGSRSVAGSNLISSAGYKKENRPNQLT